MKLVTWNINSIRIRLDLLRKLIEIENPDIICLQETKVTNDLYPKQELIEMGYKYHFFHGEKSYNGVAILSKIPASIIGNLELYNNDCRHIAVKIADTEIHNFYIPAGGDEPDVNINPKFKHKLAYCNLIADWFAQNKSSSDKIIICGDLNIAPHEHDVWSHKQLLKIVSHTPEEILHLQRIYESINFKDAIRHHDDDKKIYSWWSYRNKDWQKSNRGRRLDHIWTTHKLYDNIISSKILVEARSWDRPSDHVPVIIELKKGVL
jgi:exodeoxyribonuclease III